jgi:hypothetical protein
VGGDTCMAEDGGGGGGGGQDGENGEECDEKDAMVDLDGSRDGSPEAKRAKRDSGGEGGGGGGGGEGGGGERPVAGAVASIKQSCSFDCSGWNNGTDGSSWEASGPSSSGAEGSSGAEEEGWCPALIRLADRFEHERTCKYR